MKTNITLFFVLTLLFSILTPTAISLSESNEKHISIFFDNNEEEEKKEKDLTKEIELLFHEQQLKNAIFSKLEDKKKISVISKRYSCAILHNDTPPPEVFI